jgi:hypothetical protein
VQSYLKKYGPRKVEANALVTRPKEGRQLCRDAILKYIDPDAAQEYAADLAAKRKEVVSHIAELLKEKYGEQPEPDDDESDDDESDDPSDDPSDDEPDDDDGTD